MVKKVIAQHSLEFYGNQCYCVKGSKKQKIEGKGNCQVDKSSCLCICL